MQTCEVTSAASVLQLLAAVTGWHVPQQSQSQIHSTTVQVYGQRQNEQFTYVFNQQKMSSGPYLSRKSCKMMGNLLIANKNAQMAEATDLIWVKGYLAGLSLSALRNPLRWEPVNRNSQSRWGCSQQKCQTSSVNVGAAGGDGVQTRYFQQTSPPAR